MSNNEEEVQNSLFLAVGSDDLKQVEELVNRYGLSYFPDFDKGYALLLNATFFGYKKIVKFLLEKETNVYSKFSRTDTPLHFAAWFGDSELVQLLIDYKALIDAKDLQYETPLHIACRRGHESVVQLLLNKGANPNAIRDLPAICKEKFSHVRIGATAFASALRTGHEGFKEVLDHGARIDVSDNHKPLSFLSGSSLTEVLENRVDRRSEDAGNVTPLHLAVEMGHFQIVEWLLQNSAHVNAQTSKDTTPLLLATIGRRVDIAEVLLQHGAGVNTKDETNISPLCFAVQKRYVQMVKCLLDRGALMCDANYDSSPLLLAMRSGNKELIALFIKASCDVNMKGWICNNALVSYLLNSIGTFVRAETIRLLLDNGADPRAAPYLFHEAVRQHNINICKILIKKGADVNGLGNNNIIPAYQFVSNSFSALERSRPEFEIEAPGLFFDATWTTVKTVYLTNSVEGYKLFDECLHGDKRDATKISYGPILSSETGKSATRRILHLGSSSGIEDQNILLDHADDDSTPLHLACQEGFGNAVGLLLNEGANPEARQKNSLTPLHFAALLGHALIVETLLKFSADVDAQGALNETALHYAVLGNQTDVILLLLKNSCDVNIESVDGKTAFELALLKDQTSLHAPDSLLTGPKHVPYAIFTSPSSRLLFRLFPIKNHPEIIGILKHHLVKLKVAGVNVREKIWQLVNFDPALDEFQHMCEEEVGRMKYRTLLDMYTLYSVFVNGRKPIHMRNELLVNTLETFDYRDYPIYEDLLRSTFKKNKERIKFLDKGRKWLHILLKTQNKLSIEALPTLGDAELEEVVSYLSRRDLKSLIHCGENLKMQLCQ